MSNALDMSLKGKTVIVDKEKFNDSLGEFVCEDGFGCESFTQGTKIFGHWVSDGTKDVINGYDVKSLVKKATPSQK